MKTSKWSLLFMTALLIGCGNSPTTTTKTTDHSPVTTEVASTTEINDNLSSETETTINAEIVNTIEIDNEIKSSDYQVILTTKKKISGYEIHLKFTEEIPLNSTLTLKNIFLKSTGKTIHDLGPDINTTTKEIKFGAFVFGESDRISDATNGVSGEFVVLSFDLQQGQPSIIKQSCVDKNANIIDCDIKINPN